MEERQGELVDADVVVFPVGAGLAQRAQVTLLPRRGLRVVGDAAVVLHLVGHAEALALPFARLREEVLPGDSAVVGRIETDSWDSLAHALAGIEKAAGMGDAGEDGEVGLRDAEGLVGAVGFSPSGDFISPDEDYAGDAASGMDGATQAVEWRRVVVVDAPMGRIGGRVAGPGDFVGLGEGNCSVERVHGANAICCHHVRRNTRVARGRNVPQRPIPSSQVAHERLPRTRRRIRQTASKRHLLTPRGRQNRFAGQPLQHPMPRRHPQLRDLACIP